MSAGGFDAIVVGARCAGSPTAMLLARRGYRVLMVDRARFPSDTVSTHLIHPPGLMALDRWGLLDRVVASGCPAISRYRFDFGDLVLEGSPGTDDYPVSYAPRRTVLDALLIDAARDAGVEVREGFTVQDLLRDEDGCVIGIRGRSIGGTVETFSAHIVVGADGRNSLVARAVSPQSYRNKDRLLAAYYGYYRDLPMEGRFETYVRPDRGIAAWPTHEDLTVVIAGWPFAEFEEHKGDIEGSIGETLKLAPDFARRIDRAERVTKHVGAAVPNYFRKPYGPGWALVGDAGYLKDFITAQGMQDAFADAELCSSAIDSWLGGERRFDPAMRAYQEKRDARVGSMFELTTDLATLEPPPPELISLLQAAEGNQEATDAFVRVSAGVDKPEEFFAPDNVEKVLQAARTPA